MEQNHYIGEFCLLFDSKALKYTQARICLFCMEKSAFRGKRKILHFSSSDYSACINHGLAEIQGSRLIHPFLNQLKAEQVEILPNTIRIQCAKNQRYDVLSIPAEDDLRGRCEVR